MANKVKIKTPHAAVLVWNYADRVGTPDGGFSSSGIKGENLTKVESQGEDGSVVPAIISTLSCVSIQTQKSKGRPDGTFNLVLAPFKNWTSTLTPGSWCCIMMTNEAILENDLKHAHPNKVKMFGRIESVRCETRVDADGTRQTLYYVSGTDWGDIFNSLLYIDNLIKGPHDKNNSQGDVFAIAMRKILFSDGNSVQSFSVPYLLQSILNIMGSGNNLQNATDPQKDVNRLAGSIYEFILPKEIMQFFDFRDSKGNKIVGGKSINNFISLITGTLKSKDKSHHEKYEPSNEAEGFIDPFSLQGTHSLWQILLENSNPALNEMLCDFRWNPNDKGGVQFAVYNRIKPFCYKGYKPKAGNSNTLKSYFQNLKTNIIESDEVISVNAGTNWRDKVNFIEIKPQFSEFKIVENWQKQKSQVFDPESFQREGFRAMIVDTKQFPVKQGAKTTTGSDYGADWNKLEEWAKLMREWFFGTHRLLNGTIVIQGTTPYIGIGENIRFDAGLINPTPNINSETLKKGKNQYILAHVESVQHTFNAGPDGARSYKTTIQFVRGIIVNSNGEVFGEGMLDQDVTKVSQSSDRNRRNTVNTAEMIDPDPQKPRGT